jgi:CheY-like chemotaxis protein
MINIAIIEDEKKEQELLKEFFKKLSENLNEKIALKVFNNGKEFLFNLEFGIFDLVLMDI